MLLDISKTLYKLWNQTKLGPEQEAEGGCLDKASILAISESLVSARGDIPTYLGENQNQSFDIAAQVMDEESGATPLKYNTTKTYISGVMDIYNQQIATLLVESIKRNGGELTQ